MEIGTNAYHTGMATHRQVMGNPGNHRTLWGINGYRRSVENFLRVVERNSGGDDQPLREDFIEAAGGAIFRILCEPSWADHALRAASSHTSAATAASKALRAAASGRQLEVVSQPGYATSRPDSILEPVPYAERAEYSLLPTAESLRRWRETVRDLRNAHTSSAMGARHLESHSSETTTEDCEPPTDVPRPDRAPMLQRAEPYYLRTESPSG